jgi:hypothetical protein
LDIKDIYVRLLDEGTDVFRPVKAVAISNEYYCILLTEEFDPTDENWEFKPGHLVRVEKKDFHGVSGYLAVSV